MKRILAILIAISLLIVANPMSVNAATTTTTGKNASLETLYKILEQKCSQDGNYSINGNIGKLITVNRDSERFEQTYKPGVAYAKLIDFDGNGTEELYLHYLTVTRGDYVDAYANSEVWSIEKGKRKLSFIEKIQSDGSHGSDGEPISFCKVKGKTYLVSETGYSTGAGDFDYANYNTFLVREFVNGKIVEKYTLNESWTKLNESSKQYKKYGDITIYEWNISKNGKPIKSGKKLKASEKFHAKEITKLKDLYKNSEEIISAGSYKELAIKTNDVKACLSSIRNKMSNSKLKNRLAQKVKSTKPCEIVKCSATSVTIREFDNFYWDGEDGTDMQPRKDKKTFTIDENTVFTIMNDQFEKKNISKSDFIKQCSDYYCIKYKGNLAISITEVYHP